MQQRERKLHEFRLELLLMKFSRYSGLAAGWKTEKLSF